MGDKHMAVLATAGDESTGRRWWRAAIAGWVGGFAGNALLGLLFTSPPIVAALYNPQWQSRLFLDLAPTRDVLVSVVGLVALSGMHGCLYELVRASIPGRTWLRKGIVWGFVLWALYWLPQEWFIYVTLLREPLALAGLELVILALGSLIEGIIIARILSDSATDSPTAGVPAKGRS
jgi:hypothetical protein